MKHLTLKPLPYSKDALEPHIGRETVALHYDKHHAGYLKKLKELIADKPEATATLEWLVRTSEGPIFENAAQVWNHDFYWRSMHPDGGGDPGGSVAVAIANGFGTLDAFKRHFIDTGTHHFGSGWLWLVRRDDRLSVVATHDADLPTRDGEIALLCADLWEHAYYLDYHNERERHLTTFFDELINWDFAQANWNSGAKTAPVVRRVTSG